MKNTHSLTEGNIYRVLLSFSVPFLLANLLQALYGAVDLMVVGRFCSPSGIAAVSTGTQVTQIITSLLSGLTLGGTILVAKYMGRNMHEETSRAIGTTITAFGLFSFFLTAVLCLSVDGILNLLKVPESSFEEARQYVFICCLGTFFICEYNALSAVLRGCGDSLNPLRFVAVACVCNIAGDFFTVGVLGMGVSGTAIATIASQAVSMISAVICLNRQNFLFRFSLKNLRIDRRLLKELLSLGIPVSFQECMVRFSFLYLTAIINGFGVLAASAVGIASKYDVFAMLPATSVSSALAALTAQNMAAGKPERAKKFLKYGMSAAVLCSVLFFSWAQLSPQSMIRIFSDDPAVIAAGIPFFRACSLDYLAVAFLFCMNGYLNGCEKTLFTMANCCFGALCIRVPLLFFMACTGVESLAFYGLVSPFSTVVMLAIIGLYLMHEKKKPADRAIRPRQTAQAAES